MASFLRGKQVGMQNDLSAALPPGAFGPEEQSRCGINSQISCLAYEPIQSLLAVGTNESQFGRGKIYVFGQKRVQKSIELSRPVSIRQLQFVANKLLSLDSGGEFTVWDPDTASRIGGFVAGGSVAYLLTDPMLDWAFLGMVGGDVITYDLDRGRVNPFRIPNLWRERDQRARAVSLIDMQLHPRDIGTLLIAYSHGAVIYSFKQNKPVKFFEYRVPPGAPGGNSEATDTLRKPRLSQALWHPTGTFILTAHDDGSLVFWDPKDGRVVMARSLYNVKVDQPTSPRDKPTLIHPFVKIAWCCKQNPDDTGLLIAGGHSTDDDQKGLTFIELGQTPLYATSSWEVLSNYFRGKHQHTLQVPPGTGITDFCLVPRRSPYFSGSQDPIAVLVKLSSGEITTMSFPSGHPISPTNQLHPFLSFVHPFVTQATVATLDRGRWLGMTETRNQGEPLLKGGAEAAKPRRRYEGRNIIQVAHADGTVRIWDAGHADEMENQDQLQVDVARALGRFENIDITVMHMAELTGEFAVGTKSGEVVVYRWGSNKHYGHDELRPLEPNHGGLSDISSRAEPTLKEGLQPFVLYEMMQGPVTTVSVSDVGFVAVGSENGSITIIDLRVPSVIYQASTTDFTKKEKRHSFIKSHSSAPAPREWPVTTEFGVMTLDGDSYSSIACFIGTNQGRVITLKLLPSGQGYAVKIAGVALLDSKIISIRPIVADTGAPAVATGPVVSGLRSGQHINGILVVVTQSEIRIFKPPAAKGASKSFDEALCSAASVAEFELRGHAIVGIFGDQTARAFSLPGLKEMGRASLPMFDASRIDSSIVTRTGDIFGWSGPSEVVIVPVWGDAGKGSVAKQDTMINPELEFPPRPTISNFQWVSGTQYVSPTDLDLLVGGPNRPPSKRMVDATAAQQMQTAGGGRASSSSAAGGQEGWGDYLTRQLNERTEKLNVMADNMDDLQEQSAGWADDVSKYVNKQKRNMLLGGVTSKFF